VKSGTKSLEYRVARASRAMTIFLGAVTDAGRDVVHAKALGGERFTGRIALRELSPSERVGRRPVIRTGAKPFGLDPRSRSRQPYDCVARMPASRATAAMLAPGFSVAATSCCFFARLKRRRFRADGLIWFPLSFMCYPR
jgi:hypothetical protein